MRHELASKVFTCCSFIIKHDYKVTIYLLPHILRYMLLGCTPAEQQEVRDHNHSLTILKQVFMFYVITTVYLHQVTEEMLAVLTEGDGRGSAGGQETASSLSQLSTQTVFSMLSHLTQWSRHILCSKLKDNG